MPTGSRRGTYDYGVCNELWVHHGPVVRALPTHGESQYSIKRLDAEMVKQVSLGSHAVTIVDGSWKSLRVGWALRLSISKQGYDNDPMALQGAVGEAEC